MRSQTLSRTSKRSKWSRTRSALVFMGRPTVRWRGRGSAASFVPCGLHGYLDDVFMASRRKNQNDSWDVGRGKKATPANGGRGNAARGDGFSLEADDVGTFLPAECIARIDDERCRCRDVRIVELAVVG